jgi:hypothetical protein
VFLGLGIFFFVALFGARTQRRRYEETGSLDLNE